MQIQISTDYAIRILQYLHKHKDKLPTAKTISQAIGMTYPFFIKIAGQLKQSGLVDTAQGRNGGYKLAKQVSNISLYDVFLAIEGELKVNRCLEDAQYCSRNAVGSCSIHDYFHTLQEDLIGKLSGTYIIEFAN